MNTEATENLRRFADKQELGRRGAGIGMGLIGMLALPQLIRSLSGTLIHWLGLMDLQKYDISFSFLKPEAYYIYYAVLYLSMILVPFLMLVPIYGMQRCEVLPLNFRASGRTWVLAVLAGMGCCLVANAVTISWYDLLGELFGISSAPSALPLDRSVSGYVMYFCIYAILPAIAEEIAFRGVVFGLLRPYGKIIAIFGSAFVFGIMHGNLLQIPFAFIGGLFFGWLLEETGSILPCILLHFCNNSLSVVQTFLRKNLPVDAMDHVSYLMMILTMVVGIVCLVLLHCQRRGLFRVSEKRGVLTNPEKFRAFALNPAMIVAYLLIAIEMITTMSFRR